MTRSAERRSRLWPACGLLDALPWAIAGGMLALTGLRSEACFAFADRYGEALGRLEAWSLFAAAAAAHLVHGRLYRRLGLQ